MPQGFGVCVGLNHVSPGAYAGWNGQLAGCENDANAMVDLLKSQGFATKRLLNEEATAEGILGTIDDVARVAQPGDLVVVCYSGHGGQMADPWGLFASVDTWCVFDRQIIGHELGMLWSGFRPGCRILVLSDSCHSGTVTRRWKEMVPVVAEASKEGPTEGGPELIAAPMVEFTAEDPPLQKAMPPEIQALVEVQHRYLYRAIWKGISPPTPACPVLLLSGCQSNQLSSDGKQNGLFTENILKTWSGGSYDGDHPHFHKLVVGAMPPWQTPAFFLQSNDLSSDVTVKFMASKPFTI